MTSTVQNSLTPLSISNGDLQFIVGETKIIVESDTMAERSSVFNGMWAQRPTPERPVQVRLHHAVDDVLRYTNFVYGNYSLDMSGLFDVPLIDSLMRFGTEFRDFELRDFIVDGVAARYPTTLDNWDVTVERFGTDASANNYKCQDIDVLAFARTHGLFSAIPTILYRISFSLSLRELTEGLIRQDGSRCSLSLDDQRLCIIGKENLMIASVAMPFAWAASDGPYESTCSRRSECHQIRRTILSEIWPPIRTLNPLDQWRQYWYSMLCPICAKHGRENHRRGRQMLWDNLPGHFKLSTWEDLERFEKAQLTAPQVPVYDYVERRQN